MCNDDPGWRIFFNTLQGLFHHHPVKIDIAGTIESIAQITPELLYRCYHTFYNLHNMVLSVAGNCKVDEVVALADKLLKPCEDMQLECIFPEEPMEIVRAETVETAPIGTTMFVLGYKVQAGIWSGKSQEGTAGNACSESFNTCHIPAVSGYVERWFNQ